MATTTARVNGVAAVGDLVHYFDIANQNRNAELVVSTPPQNETEHGWSKGYGLLDTETGLLRYSDLRQYGWTFAGKTELVTVEQVSAGDEVSVGSGFFTVKSIRDGLRKGRGLRTTEGEYTSLPWGYPVRRKVRG